MSNVVLDASAILALLKQEPGAETVLAALSHAWISAVNLSEVVAKLTEGNIEKEKVISGISRLGITVVSFNQMQAFEAGFLRPLTRPLGLSLGDRACLSLGMTYKLPILTTDRAWLELNLPVNIQVVR